MRSCSNSCRNSRNSPRWRRTASVSGIQLFVKCIFLFNTTTIPGTLLTTALMMRAIDRPRYHSTTLDRLTSLATLDPARAGYYKDLANKWSIEEALQKWINVGSFKETLDLSESNIVTLNYDQYLCVAECISLGNCVLRPETEKKLEDIYAVCGVLILKEED